ncbi:MAG: protease pro-enzyme activation domain-containing protein, partial [Dokdonella sp.]
MLPFAMGALAVSAQSPTNALRNNLSPGIATVSGATALRYGDFIEGSLATKQPIHIEVALKMRDRAGLDNFVSLATQARALGIPADMSSSRFLADHAPSEAQAKLVADFLTDAGFKNVVVAPNRLFVSADGTAAIAQSAFLTSLARVTTRDGRDTYANTDAVHIPASLQDIVLSVIGLQDVHQAHTFNAAAPNAVTGHNPKEFSSIYGGTGV